MADVSELKALKERCERASGPDQEIDLALAEAMGAGLEHTPRAYTGKIAWPEDRRCRPCPKFTASIEAAIALVERVLPGCFYLFGKGRTRATEPLYGLNIMFGSDEVLGGGEHDAPALAILSALLSALISRAEARPETAESGERVG